MKPKSKKTTAGKAAKQLARQNLLAAHHRTVRHDGQTYLVRVAQLGTLLLADAEPMTGTDRTLVNLFHRTKLAQELRGLCEKRCYS